MFRAAQDKHLQLSDLIRDHGRLVVAYSGGVDSAFLTAVAHEAIGSEALAVTAVSPSLARRDLQRAKDLAAQRGWEHILVGTHEVAREEYARNDSDRCYWCKTELFEVLQPIAEQRDAHVAVGTNVDDLGDHRPGLRAADESAVLSPMVEVGLTKQEIRDLSREMGLPTADQPASPCLASRFAYGVRVTPEGLRRVEAAEEFVAGFGFAEFRVRDHGDNARLEVAAADIPRAASLSTRLAEGLKALGYRYVSLDMEGFRSGSMNDVLPMPVIGHSESR